METLPAVSSVCCTLCDRSENVLGPKTVEVLPGKELRFWMCDKCIARWIDAYMCARDTEVEAIKEKLLNKAFLAGWKPPCDRADA